MKSPAGKAAHAEILEATDRCTTPNYARYPVAFTHGRGSRVLWAKEVGMH